MILPVPKIDQERKGREKVRALSRLARAALRQSCEKCGLVLDTLPKDDKGVPQPVNGVYWSLSHKPEIAGGVAAGLPVGLDLETIRPVRAALQGKVGDADEWRLVDGRTDRTFFRFWTAKEAVLKAVGQGMVGLSRCRIIAIADDTHMTLSYDGVPWPVEHCWFGRHVAAITIHDFIVDWQFIANDTFPP